MRRCRWSIRLAVGSLAVAAFSGLAPATVAVPARHDQPAPSVDLPLVAASHGDASAHAVSLSGDLTDVEQELFKDAADGRWDDHTLLTAALVASGVDCPDAVRCYQAQLDDLAAELEHALAGAASPREKADRILQFLHHRVLTGGYCLDCTDLTRALDEGRYNCVSASVLFICLATRSALPSRALEIPGHAMCRVRLPRENLDVETTCPDWFRLADDPEKQSELVENTLGIRSPATRREVSDVQFVATIYYNRGVDLLAEGLFAEAVAANAKALRLDPANVTAKGNLLATINNWAIHLGAAGRFDEAAGLLRTGLRLDPHYEIFKTNHVNVYLQWAESLCREGDFATALARLEVAGLEQPGQPHFEQARLDVYRRWTEAAPEPSRLDKRSFAP